MWRRPYSADRIEYWLSLRGEYRYFGELAAYYSAAAIWLVVLLGLLFFWGEIGWSSLHTN